MFNLVSAACLLAYAVLLGTAYLDLPGRLLGGAPLLDVRSVAGAWAVARGLLVRIGLLSLRAAPLGLLAVLALPDREGRLARLFRVALPAMAVALALASLALAARAGWTRPGPFELVLPAVGILLGVWAGLAWRRGWWSRLVFLPKVAALGLLLLLGALVLGMSALEREPAVGERPPLTSAEKRHLVGLFRGKDPRRVPPGQTRTVRLTAQELDQLVTWVAAVGFRARTTVSLAPGGVSGVATVAVPRTGRWLNATASTRAAIDKGRLSLAEPRLRVGRVTIPPLLLDLLAPFAVAGLQGDRDLRRVLPAVESLRASPEEAVLTYGRVDMPRGLIARLVWGEDASEEMRDAVRAQVDGLLDALARAPEGDARFAAAAEAAFALARSRSGEGSAVEENRSALLALGIVLGHPRIARAVGETLDSRRSALAETLRERTTLRGRADWTRHFALSGALTVVSAVAPSDAAGLLKEELDADGGSGFSFGDLLADRAGTTFAEVATRDEARAAAVQERLAGGFRVDEFFPRADGLPEGIPDAELQARYGGVGGPLYRRTAGEIERRVSACAAYRE
ncbi:MAG TPA: hypothetical protein VLF95_13400 [Vicinamibacteria bacterium]|nr:hypothetical protein [Vicinamibacteria bacterium]